MASAKSDSEKELEEQYIKVSGALTKQDFLNPPLDISDLIAEKICLDKIVKQCGEFRDDSGQIDRLRPAGANGWTNIYTYEQFPKTYNVPLSQLPASRKIIIERDCSVVTDDLRYRLYVIDQRYMTYRIKRDCEAVSDGVLLRAIDPCNSSPSFHTGPITYNQIGPKIREALTELEVFYLSGNAVSHWKPTIFELDFAPYITRKEDFTRRVLVL